MIKIQQRFFWNTFSTRGDVWDILFGAFYRKALNPETAVIKEIARPNFVTVAKCVGGV